MNTPAPKNQPESKEKKGFLGGLTSSIDAITAELKADLASMTPAEKSAAEKRNAELAKKATGLQAELANTTQGLREETVREDGPAQPHPTRKGQTVPLWDDVAQGRTGAVYQTDGLFLAQAAEDVTRYVRALLDETAPEPFTVGLLAASLPAPGDGLQQAEDTVKAVCAALEQGGRVHGVLGAGPRQLWADPQGLLDKLTELFGRHTTLVGLGPVGLDEGFAPYAYAQQQTQLAVQLQLAAQWGLPVWLSHRRGALGIADVLRAMPKPPTLIVADVLETQDDVALVENFDAYVLLRPELTDPAQTFYRMAVMQVPQKKLLLASGNALVAPHGFAGHFNQPKFLQNTLLTASNLLNTTPDALRAVINQNLMQALGVRA
jgi:Tat protein secretion system quality control protein TatD with DNase activity